MGDGTTVPQLRRHQIICFAALLALTLLTFGDLFFAGQAVLSAEGTDLYLQDFHWRAFGFGQLRKGRVALWNPHIFSGAPYFGAFQSALLYPLNLHYLFLPLPAAINLGIALHVFLAGLFMYLWAAHRRLHPVACLLAGGLYMFCGPHFLHIWAGHLGRLCAITWVPLIFLAVDGWLDRRRPGWVLLGTLAVGMQLLGGDPQYVFYTAVAAGIYFAIRLWQVERRVNAALGFAAIFLGGAALGAVQLIAGLDATRGSIRGHAVPYHFAVKFALPPENLLTLIAPGFFGDMVNFDYWGRCYLWETSLFFGVAGLALAALGAVAAEKSARRFSLAMAAALFILALGAHTPLFELLYRYAPGFDKFRGVSKFSLQMTAFLILLAACGADVVLRSALNSRRAALVAIVASAAVFSLALAVWSSANSAPAGLWQRALSAIPPKMVDGRYDPMAESVYFPYEAYSNPDFARKAGRFSAATLMVAAGLLALVAALFFCLRFSPAFAYGIVFLGLGEVLVFAAMSRPTFDSSRLRAPALEQLSGAASGDYRILNPALPNLAMSGGFYDIWGYAPLVPGRYAELMAFLQGQNPDEVTQYVDFRRDHPLLDMLRLRFAILPTRSGLNLVERPGAMPRLLLLRECRVLRSRDEIFAAMVAPGFDPRRQVILESLPDPLPDPRGREGRVRLVAQSTDSLTIEAQLDAPAILLITDGWYPGWRARPAGSAGPKRRYEVMPANYVLRAVPLEKGAHLLRLEYAPRAFFIGAAISAAAAILLVLMAILELRLRHRPATGDESISGSQSPPKDPGTVSPPPVAR